jgi:hypothetical protein
LTACDPQQEPPRLQLVERKPDPGLLLPCPTPVNPPPSVPKPTDNEIGLWMTDIWHKAWDCKLRHQALVDWLNGAPAP